MEPAPGRDGDAQRPEWGDAGHCRPSARARVRWQRQLPPGGRPGALDVIHNRLEQCRGAAAIEWTAARRARGVATSADADRGVRRRQRRRRDECTRHHGGGQLLQGAEHDRPEHHERQSEAVAGCQPRWRVCKRGRRALCRAFICGRDGIPRLGDAHVPHDTLRRARAHGRVLLRRPGAAGGCRRRRRGEPRNQHVERERGLHTAVDGPNERQLCDGQRGESTRVACATEWRMGQLSR